MSSQDKQSEQTLVQALNIDIEQTIKDYMAADKGRAGEDADKKIMHQKFKTYPKALKRTKRG